MADKDFNYLQSICCDRLNSFVLFTISQVHPSRVPPSSTISSTVCSSVSKRPHRPRDHVVKRPAQRVFTINFTCITLPPALARHRWRAPPASSYLTPVRHTMLHGGQHADGQRGGEWCYCSLRMKCTHRLVLKWPVIWFIGHQPRRWASTHAQLTCRHAPHDCSQDLATPCERLLMSNKFPEFFFRFLYQTLFKKTICMSVYL